MGYAWENAAFRERSAFLAAEIDAKRKLAEWIAGAELESVTIVAEGTVITDTIRLTVKAKLPGTTIVAQSYDAVAGVARVTVEMVLSK
jgi:hypothetical protein